MKVIAAVCLSFSFLIVEAQSADSASQTFPVGNDPGGLVFDGANVWVTSEGDNTVTKLRASDGANLGTFDVQGTNPQQIIFDGTNIWISNYQSGNVSKLRASDGAFLGSFAIGPLPTGMAFDGANIWVASNRENNITKLRASDGVPIGVYRVGQDPNSVLFDGSSIWVSGDGVVVKLDPADGSLLGRVILSSTFVPGPMLFDGNKIWVVLANVSPGRVTVVRPDNGHIEGTVILGGSNLSGITFDGRQIWVSALGDNAVSRLSSKTGEYRGGGPTDSPAAMCFDGTSIWVVNRYGTTVTKVTPLNNDE